MSYRDAPSLGDVTQRDVSESMSRGERIFRWFAIVNFVVFAAVATYIGGDAISGRSSDGHFFLMQHGQYREVSRGLFTYSLVHTVVTILVMPIAVISGLRARARAVKPR